MNENALYKITQQEGNKIIAIQRLSDSQSFKIGDVIITEHVGKKIIRDWIINPLPNVIEPGLYVVIDTGYCSVEKLNLKP